MQRLLDVIAAALGLLFFSPIGIPIVLLLRVTGERKIFYRQKRVGKDGVLFDMLKFATMLEDSPNLGTGDITVKGDPRVLPVGRVLRKTKLNEVPQLVNVLLGDMSLVGPRPLTPRNFGCYPERIQREIVGVRPGLTGVGSIVFRDEERILANSTKTIPETYKEDIAPYKGELELWYLRNRSVRVYFRLLFLTVWAVLFPGTGMVARFLPELPPPPPTLGLAAGQR